MKISKVMKHGQTRWRVAFVESGKEVRRFFKTKGAADAYGAKVEGQREDLGGVWIAATAAQRVEMVESWRRAQRGGYTLYQACDAFETEKPGSSLTMGDLARRFLAAKTAQKLRPRSLRGLTASVNAFVRPRAEMEVTSVTPEDIGQHINRPEWSAVTRKTTLIDLGTLFNWAVSMELMDRSPAAKVPKPKVEAGTKCVHLADQVEKILRTCEERDPEMIGYAALGYFAGLRPESEIQRLPAENIAAGHIRIDRWNKTRRSRDVTVRPNLAAWLARWRAHGWPVCPANAAERWREVRKTAGFASREQDVMRHTFVSAHYMLHGEASTVREAGHSAEELHASYRALMTTDQAKAIFEIYPRAEPYGPRPLPSNMVLLSAKAREMARRRWSTRPTPSRTAPDSRL